MKARQQGSVISGTNGLYYLRARYYDPTIGRFLTRDPLPGSARDPQSLNAYPYVQNNPVNRVDPSGMLTESNLFDVRGCLLFYGGTATTVLLIQQLLRLYGGALLMGAPLGPGFWIYSGLIFASLYITVEYGLDACQEAAQSP